jgi:hypothetical protein
VFDAGELFDALVDQIDADITRLKATGIPTRQLAICGWRGFDIASRKFAKP